MSEATTTSQTIGVPKETAPGERRVALSPAALPALVKAGLSIVVEAGAGESAGFSDQAYVDKGGRIGTRAEALAADAVVMVRVADDAALRQGQVVVGMAAPFAAPETSKAIADRGVTLFSLELAPRTTRAQAVDVLSSQATVSGYKAVLLAAEALPKLFPLMTTAAGTIPPARVFIMGAGVAGLSAIATARRLGAVVEAYDVRSAVKEEVQSLGARFVELPLETGQEAGSSGAYATQLTDEQLAKQRELMVKTVGGSDVVITTAQVQGKKAPVLVTADMVAAMNPGSVIVDLAAEQGGNCELTRVGETVVHNGVTIIGPANITSTAAHDASLMYGKNVANFLILMVVDKKLAPDTDDAILTESMVTRGGEVVNARVRETLGLPPQPATAQGGPSA